MARPILILVLAAPLLARAADCASAKDLQKDVTASPFYEALVAKAGKPLSCHADQDGAKRTLTYTFKNHTEFRAQVDPAIELNEQRITMRMPMAKAIALLKAAEQQAYKGCGIAWDHPPEKSGRDTVYRGTSCNCQARITTRGNYALMLVLKSAC